MLSLNLEYIFKVRGIEQPFTFLTTAGFTHYTASAFIHKKVKNIKLKHIELLCTALLCEPQDLFEWSPNKNKIYPDNFPLRNLIKDESVADFRQKLNKMSLKELEELSKKVISEEQKEID